jgi:hypothetical protein
MNSNAAYSREPLGHEHAVRVLGVFAERRAVLEPEGRIENRQKNGPWREFREPRQDLDPSRNPEHQRTEDKVDGEDIHRVASRLTLGSHLPWARLPSANVRGVCLFLPPRDVHASHEEPQHQHDLRQGAEGQNIGRQSGCKRRPQEGEPA